MSVINTNELSHQYGRKFALRSVNLDVPEQSIFAVLGPNGSGKTTLMQILMGMRRPTSGTASIFGQPVSRLPLQSKASIGYVAEGLQLPWWMTLGQLRDFVAPLHVDWDQSLFLEVREKFQLDLYRKLKTFSRGEKMKAALLCALAARPKLLIMDEPFAGMDALIREELIDGLLQSSATDGCTILICSHDLGELETFVDAIAFLNNGELLLSDTMDSVRNRFRKVEVFSSSELAHRVAAPPEWLSVESAGQRLEFVTSASDQSVDEQLRKYLQTDLSRVEERPATIREVFLGLARSNSSAARMEIRK